MFGRGKGEKKPPKNVNKYLAQESELKKIEIVEGQIESKSTRRNLLLKRPKDKLDDIRKTTSDVMHRVVYFNSKIDEKADRLQSQEKQVNFQKQLTNIEKKKQELNERTDKS